PSLAISWRREKAIDDLRVRRGGCVGEKCIDFGRSGRKTGEIERRASDESSSIRMLCRNQSLLFQPGQDEVINSVRGPPFILDIRNRSGLYRQKGPESFLRFR